MTERYYASKTFHDFPCAHRIPEHDGACAKLHGYCRSFRFDFVAEKLNGDGFVIDLSALGVLENFLRSKFDHTVLIRSDDPHLDMFKALDKLNALSLQVFPVISSEYFARWLFDRAPLVMQGTYYGEGNFVSHYSESAAPQVEQSEAARERGVALRKVHVFENNKIRAAFGVV